MKWSERKFIVMNGFSICCFVAIGLLFGYKTSPFKFINSLGEPRSITLNKYTDIGSTGTFSFLTLENNNIKFKYEDLSPLDNNLGTLSKGGIIYNNFDDSLTYKNAIGSLSSITVTFDGELSLDYSWGGEISSTYIRHDINLVSGSVFNFNGESPNYFRINALEDTDIESISIKYDCGTNENYPEGYYAIKNEAQLKSFRDEVNGGDKYIGKTVLLTADIDLNGVAFVPIGKSASVYFSGTFDGCNHMISNLTIDSSSGLSNQLGLFSCVTNGTVKNLKIDNVNVTDPGNRASALIGRAYDVVVENIEILSGNITGTAENGSVIGVIAGTNETIVKNCINRANVTGTTGGGNGGIIGYLYGGVLNISNCVNYGNITSIANNKTTGGILGSTRDGGILNINHCYISSDATVKNGNATANTNFSQYVGLISSGNEKQGRIGVSDLIINNENELRSFLASSDNYTGKNVVLTNNLDLNKIANFDETDHGRSTAFKGIFDGLGHTIKNFKSKGETTAIFKSLISSVVTNLKIENINIIATGSRGSSIASRVENSTVEEIEVLSGEISGVKENAGVVSAVTGTVTIDNCINRANITASSSSNGGVVADSVTTATILTISNCVNYGTIRASALACGGILGGTVSNGTGTSLIQNCINYGDVYGTQYTGGIIGIARESSSESLISGCRNYGNVTGSSNVSAGGIVGLARFNVEGCCCYANARISLNNVSSHAYNLTEYQGVVSGTSAGGNHRGYILGTLGNDAVASSNSLCNNDGEDIEMVAKGNTSVNQAYGRIQEFADGRNILTMANRFSISTAPGFKSYGALINRDTAIADGGFGYDYIPNHPETNDYKLWLANMEPLVLDDGRLFIFYRTDNKETSTPGVYYSSIRAIESRDNGETWLPTRHIIFENYTTDTYGDGTLRGPYEPFAVIDGNTLQIFIAFDAGETLAGGFGPDNSDFICSNYYQNLLRIPVDISNMGFNVGEPAMAIKGVSSYRRPGMPSVVKLNDGNYAMILEHNGSNSEAADYAMRIAISYSHDLINWTAPRVILSPDNSGIVFGTYKYLCGAPYIQLLPDGKIVVSYTTNENFKYDELLSGVDLGYYKTVELAISDSVVSYGSTPNMIKTHMIKYNKYYGARYGGCKVIGNKVILIANEYTFTYNESKSIYERTVGRGAVFSILDYAD